MDKAGLQLSVAAVLCVCVCVCVCVCILSLAPYLPCLALLAHAFMLGFLSFYLSTVAAPALGVVLRTGLAKVGCTLTRSLFFPLSLSLSLCVQWMER